MVGVREVIGFGVLVSRTPPHMGKKRDGKNGRLPKHNNDFKFKHNPKSKKSDQIATITHSGLCHRCSDKIAWKKKYRKYKPLKRSGKCYMCEQRTVKRAYHTICAQCSLDHHCCAWCKLDFHQQGSGGVVISREERVELAQAEGAKLNEQLSTMRERDRRTVLRRLQRSDSEGEEEQQLLKLDHYSSEEEEAVEVGAMAAVADGEKKVDGAQEAEDEGIKPDAMVAQDVEASSLLDLSTKTNLTVKNTFFGKKKKGVEY